MTLTPNANAALPFASVARAPQSERAQLNSRRTRRFALLATMAFVAAGSMARSHARTNAPTAEQASEACASPRAPGVYVGDRRLSLEEQRQLTACGDRVCFRANDGRPRDIDVVTPEVIVASSGAIADPRASRSGR